jgi:hypothetical protein
MLNVVRDVVVPNGSRPSRFADPAEIDLALETLEDRFVLRESPSRDSLAVMVPLTEQSLAAVRLSCGQPHPWYGAGLSVATSLEIDLEKTKILRTWAAFVDAQLDNPEGRGYGSWAIIDFGGGHRLAFCRFVPNMSFGAGVLRDVLTGEIGRAQWVAEQRLLESA